MPDETNIEEKFIQLQREFDATKSALDETRKQLENTERRQRIDHALLEADTIDLGAARLLTELAVGQMNEADVKLAVDELRASKPYLFRRRRAEGGAMAPRTRTAGPALDDAAETAATSGDRRDLLRYLRLKRHTQ